MNTHVRGPLVWALITCPVAMAVVAAVSERRMPAGDVARPAPAQAIDALYAAYLALSVLAAVMAARIWGEMRACAWLVLALLTPFVFVVYHFARASAAGMSPSG